MILKSIQTDVAGMLYCKDFNNTCQFLEIDNYCCLYEQQQKPKQVYDFQYVLSCKDCVDEIKEAHASSVAMADAWKQRARMSRKIDRGKDVCEYSGCVKDAIDLVYSRNQGKILKLCDYHGDIVLEEGHPEYTDECQNCGCFQGVN